MLTAVGLYLTAFIYTYSEWRPTEELNDIGIYSTTAFSEKFNQAGERFQGAYLLYAWGPEEKHPYVNYSASPRLRIYDQIENLVLSVALQPTKRIYLNFSLEKSGYYTFVFKDVELRDNCFIILKGYTNNKVYPYQHWWTFSMGLFLLGVIISFISLRGLVPMRIRFHKKNSNPSSNRIQARAHKQEDFDS